VTATGDKGSDFLCALVSLRLQMRGGEAGADALLIFVLSFVIACFFLLFFFFFFFSFPRIFAHELLTYPTSNEVRLLFVYFFSGFLRLRLCKFFFFYFTGVLPLPFLSVSLTCLIFDGGHYGREIGRGRDILSTYYCQVQDLHSS